MRKIKFLVCKGILVMQCAVICILYFNVFQILSLLVNMRRHYQRFSYIYF